MPSKPTGPRPKPSLPKQATPNHPSMRKTKAAIKHTPMPSPNRDSTMGDTSKRRR